MFTRILVPLDGSALGERALPYAALLARATGGAILLLYAASDGDIPEWQRSELGVVPRLDALAEQLEQEGTKATVWIEQGDPASMILDAARASRADLIVMSTHGRSGLGRWLYGSVAEEVLSQATTPILLAPAACERAWPSDRALRVLIPLDGSPTAEAALAPARALAASLRADALLLRMVEPTERPALRIEPIGVHVEMASPDGAADDARAYLDDVASMANAPFRSIDTLVDLGDAASKIVQTARQEDVDVIVMATHGRTGLARLTLGSVARATLHRTCVPLLLVRPAQLGEPISATPTESRVTPTESRATASGDR